MAIWTYCGPRMSTGEMERSLIYSGIPALDEIDDATLTKEQIAVLTKSGIYEESKKVQKSPDKSGKEA